MPNLTTNEPSAMNHWPNIPLAEALRPKSIAEVVGQEHLLSQGKPLQLSLESKQAHSMILWGPPGVGKTSLARLMADSFNCDFISISAVLAGVKEIRLAIEQAEKNLAQFGKKTLLFVDEIHRFNKGQQDALLHFVESGLITFIGATTENPSFEVNSALLSRSRTYVLKSLDQSDMFKLLEKVKTFLPTELSWDQDAIEIICAFADGDGRRFLNMIEQVLRAAQTKRLQVITLTFTENLLSTKSRRFDHGGEYFYDQISALHKSVRGSNPDAALYWLCRMLDGGADPLYLARRIVRMAWEDIGLADPRAIQIANDAIGTYERLGSPEGELALGQAVIYLSMAAKSNAGYKAFNAAKAFVKNDHTQEVPIHLRNAPTKLMKELGYGHAYRYAHDEPNAYAAGEHYLPDNMPPPNWYQPTDRGLEIQIQEKMQFLKDLDAKATKKN